MTFHYDSMEQQFLVYLLKHYGFWTLPLLTNPIVE